MAEPATTRTRDDRAFYALAALGGLALVALALPMTRAWILNEMIEPLRGQADPIHAVSLGYSPSSLAAWALVGAVLAWAAYEFVFHRLGYEPDRDFFVALAPFLVAGPLAHALLAVGAYAWGSPLAYAATEPVIYLTIAIVATGALALGRATKQPVRVPVAVGALLVLGLAPFAAPHVTGHAALLFSGLVLVALAAAAAVAWAYRRARQEDPYVAVLAVVFAHALDGLTTWMVLRDPLHFGFRGFSEKNPFSLALVSLSNGWPYFVVKLALPLLLLSLVKSADSGPREDAPRRVRTDPQQRRQKAFLLFAIFVLGYGPGMANAMQVLLSA